MAAAGFTESIVTEVSVGLSENPSLSTAKLSPPLVIGGLRGVVHSQRRSQQQQYQRPTIHASNFQSEAAAHPGCNAAVFQCRRYRIMCHRQTLTRAAAAVEARALRTAQVHIRLRQSTIGHLSADAAHRTVFYIV
ncbi:hypothetical protein [Xanthomonas oryzae]|uniref:hypothetical protein n=1 Tax=Xanthomonas oryzae TaxID=347 RepID=UPI0015E152D8|nr:hypothetical protein [Xanthomonas oryzae]